jgi:hypothetical protein
MNNKSELIDKIRELLNQIEGSNSNEDAKIFTQNFDALEIPKIAAEIIDYLQPELLPYEAAIYWHLFRKSVLGTGQQYTRASVRGLANGVISSASGQSKTLSYGTVQNSLASLEQKGAILKAGDTNREGTLYKVCLPEEIQICQQRMNENRIIEHKAIDDKKELDYYNVSENRIKIFERDAYKCKYCGKQLTRFTATLDHLEPISKKGDHSFENLITSCLHCNSRRGNRTIMDFITNEKNQ